MTDTLDETPGRDWSKLAPLSSRIAILAIVFALVSGPGNGFGLWSFTTGFLILGISFLCAVVALITGVIGFVASRRRQRKDLHRSAAIGLVLSTLLVLMMISQVMAGRGIPPIHDVTTNLDSPPQFSVLTPRRHGEGDPLRVPDGGRDDLSALTDLERHHVYHSESYSDLKPVTSSGSISETTERAARVASEMGWEIATVDPASGRLEATATTFWFRFKDDIVIRVAAKDDGSVLDIRSVSRVGMSDIGKNASRIREFIRRFRATG